MERNLYSENKDDGISPNLELFALTHEWKNFYESLLTLDSTLSWGDSELFKFEMSLESGRRILVRCLDFEAHGLTVFEMHVEVDDFETFSPQILGALKQERWLPRGATEIEMLLNRRSLMPNFHQNRFTAIHSACTILGVLPNTPISSVSSDV